MRLYMHRLRLILNMSDMISLLVRLDHCNAVCAGLPIFTGAPRRAASPSRSSACTVLNSKPRGHIVCTTWTSRASSHCEIQYKSCLQTQCRPLTTVSVTAADASLWHSVRLSSARNSDFGVTRSWRKICKSVANWLTSRSSRRRLKSSQILTFDREHNTRFQ